jgi:hypothetical protein
MGALPELIQTGVRAANVEKQGSAAGRDRDFSVRQGSATTAMPQASQRSDDAVSPEKIGAATYITGIRRSIRIVRSSP